MIISVVLVGRLAVCYDLPLVAQGIVNALRDIRFAVLVCERFDFPCAVL